jgi:hypothetical protein
MKKLLVTLVASVFSLIGANAEENTSLVATLSHGNSLTAYYGKGALVEAYDAAQPGDIITLSAGTFTGKNFAKNITVRGAGGWADGSSDNNYTIIEGSWTFKLQSDENELTIEGVRFTSQLVITSDVYKACTISKVKFDSYLLTQTKVFAKLNHCVTLNYLQLYQGVCTSCALKDVIAQTGTDKITLQNCVISNYGLWHNGSLSEDVLTNCIFICTSDYQLAASNDVHNCVYFNTSKTDYDFFANATNATNKIVTDRDNFFKSPAVLKKNTDQYGDLSSYDINFDDLNVDGTGLFELSDNAKQLYKGNDGTVVGVWGGAAPFNVTPSNPRITKCEIVPKVNAEGKLSVTIEVAQ